MKSPVNYILYRGLHFVLQYEFLFCWTTISSNQSNWKLSSVPINLWDLLYLNYNTDL